MIGEKKNDWYNYLNHGKNKFETINSLQLQQLCFMPSLNSVYTSLVLDRKYETYSTKPSI